jgi:hypothetical protein
VLRLTWRNLLARKVRLLMSTLAIVLGIGFLADGRIVDELRNPDRDQILEKMVGLQDAASAKAAG